MPPKVPPCLKLGDRIQVDQDLATVRYIGPVDQTDGEWLGIEWDDFARGKHNGDKDGRHYFSCRREGAGSFIRYSPKRVHIGVSFLTALKDKYLPSNPELLQKAYDPQQDKGHIQFGGNTGITVETVGFEKIERKQCNLQTLAVAGLKLTRVASEDLPLEIADTCPNLHDLDLSRNLIPHWETLLKIISQLHKLRVLWLNDLRMDLALNAHVLSYSPFASLKILSLKNAAITTEEIRHLSPILINLEELTLSSNALEDIDIVTDDHSSFQQLKLVQVEENNIDSWDKVLKLSKLPKLEQINLNTNKLVSIQPRREGDFPSLRYLHLNNNLISDWKSIDALNSYKTLEHVRCKQNPVLEGIQVYLINVQLVGRISSLTRANGDTILLKDRIDMERYYLKLCTKDGTSDSEISRKHPRYIELCNKNGRPIMESPEENASSALKNRLLNVKLCHRSGSADEMLELQAVEELSECVKLVAKRLLGTMSIRTLQNIIQKLFQIPSSEQRLFLVQTSQQGSFAVQELDDPLRELKYYDIQSGDEITIVH